MYSHSTHVELELTRFSGDRPPTIISPGMVQQVTPPALSLLRTPTRSGQADGKRNVYDLRQLNSRTKRNSIKCRNKTGQGSWPPSFLISPSRRNYGTKAVENALLAFSKKARVGKSDNGCEGTPVCRTPGGVSRSYSCTGASAKLWGQGSWHRHSPPHFPVSCCGLAPGRPTL